MISDTPKKRLNNIRLDKELLPKNCSLFFPEIYERWD